MRSLQKIPFLAIPQVLHDRLKFSLAYLDSRDITGKELLDIGSGFGWFEHHIQRMSPRSVTAMEPSAELSQMAQKQLQAPNIIHISAAAPILPFPENAFDVAVCFEVLEHIPPRSENALFREIARVLRPGGVLYLSTPHRSFWSVVLDPAWWLIAHRHYSRHTMRTFATSNGFSILSLTLRGRMWFLLGCLNLYISKWLLKRPMIAEQFFHQRMDLEYDKEGYATIFMKLQVVK